MIVNAYVVIDPDGDRPYISTSEPKSLDTKNGRIKIYRYALHVPDGREDITEVGGVVFPDIKS